MISLSQKYIKKKKLQEVHHLQMGRATELGGNQCSASGKESWRSQEGSAPEETTEKLLEETRDGSLLLFLVGMCCSGIAVMKDV